MPHVNIDRLIRSRRRTIGLQITQDARLIVRAPFYASEHHIQKLVDRKESWIRAKQEYFLNRKPKLHRFLPGEEFLWMGQVYPLIAVDHLPKAIVFDKAFLISSQVLSNARDHIENWYKSMACEHIPQRVAYYARTTGLTFKSLRINSATTRWGSCGYGNTLNFTWRLMMAPIRVIDYVVVHELMHIKQKNHSRHFWAEVKRVLPDYQQDEHWLKENSHLLRWDI